MTDICKDLNDKDEELKAELEKVDWPIQHGIISVKVRDGKPTLVTIERTVKMD